MATARIDCGLWWETHGLTSRGEVYRSALSPLLACLETVPCTVGYFIHELYPQARYGDTQNVAGSPCATRECRLHKGRIGWASLIQILAFGAKVRGLTSRVEGYESAFVPINGLFGNFLCSLSYFIYKCPIYPHPRRGRLFFRQDRRLRERRVGWASSM